MAPESSLFRHWIVSRSRPWLPVVIAFLLLLACAAAAALDGALDEFLGKEQWRGLAIAPAVILYITIAAPIVGRAEHRVLSSLRPLLQLTDEQFSHLTADRLYIKPATELAVVAAGTAIGLAIGFANAGSITFSWRLAYFMVTSPIMFALFAWVTYVSVAGTRRVAALHRQPLHVNLFDTTPFEAVGRQSVLLALVFVVGITLSPLFQAAQPDSLRSPIFWLSYLPQAVVPVVVFFLNMLPTHRVLAEAKEQELRATRARIFQEQQAMQDRLAAGQSDAGRVAEATLLLAYEQRLRDARTWPYNTTMLRTIFFSALVPIITTVIQRLWGRLFP
jgi:hypothetical protein